VEDGHAVVQDWRYRQYGFSVWVILREIPDAALVTSLCETPA
jgi:hypothetical protein